MGCGGFDAPGGHVVVASDAPLATDGRIAGLDRGAKKPSPATTQLRTPEEPVLAFGAGTSRGVGYGRGMYLTWARIAKRNGTALVAVEAGREDGACVVTA